MFLHLYLHSIKNITWSKKEKEKENKEMEGFSKKVMSKIYTFLFLKLWTNVAPNARKTN